MTAQFEPIIGRYMHLDHLGGNIAFTSSKQVRAPAIVPSIPRGRTDASTAR